MRFHPYQKDENALFPRYHLHLLTKVSTALALIIAKGNGHVCMTARK